MTLTIHNMEHYGECRYVCIYLFLFNLDSTNKWLRFLGEFTCFLRAKKGLSSSFLKFMSFNLFFLDELQFNRLMWLCFTLCRQEQLSKCGLDGSVYATEDKVRPESE